MGCGSKSVKVTRVIRIGLFGPKFPVSDGEDVSQRPGTRRVLHVIYSLVSGEKENQSILPTLAVS